MQRGICILLNSMSVSDCFWNRFPRSNSTLRYSSAAGKPEVWTSRCWRSCVAYEDSRGAWGLVQLWGLPACLAGGPFLASLQPLFLSSTLLLQLWPSASLTRTLWLRLPHSPNPGKSSHFPMLRLITCAKSLLWCKVVWSRVPWIRAWPSLGVTFQLFTSSYYFLTDYQMMA